MIMPEQKIKVLLLENIHPDAAKQFRENGVDIVNIDRSLKEDELCEKVKDVHVIGIRSKTQVTEKVLDAGKNLLAVGAYCIGTNQIDISACSRRGVAVFNAPYSNTRSVVELALGEIIMLIRGVFDKSTKLHQGVWQKSAAGNYEIRGKRLGIIGYGNIGAQLSVMAEAVGMKVYYYDLEEKLSLGNARKCDTMEELLAKCDIITLHVDGRPENRGLIGENEFNLMKRGVIFLNLSRGFVVDLQSLVQNIHNGKIIGAAVDVFPEEPNQNNERFQTELQQLPNVILTPHIGGSTEEAQRNIADFVTGKIIDFIYNGGTSLSINLPNLQLPEIRDAHRLIHLHENVPGIMAKINNILARHSINIVGQYLKTNEYIGYVITDIAKEYERDVIAEIKNIPGTIRFRILY
ncbi:MAG: phosphoglycerate dehydrogenase [Candidatus Neomarinimicrobiota bacterium]|nr:MAG: phosphoglycerate dehydrogenase [Candidatus Neomarinimicrobiota bacterium]